MYFAAMSAKQNLLLVVLAGLALLSGYLMSKASLIGRLGMTYVYREYGFLKSWWKGALVVFIIWMVLLILQLIVEKKLSKQRAIIIHVVFILLALVGLYFTYSDFQHTTTHRWLKERFHIGAYIFWLGWIIISMFCIVQKKEGIIEEKSISAE